MPSVVFDPAAFKVAYPAFAAVSDGLLGTYFNQATLYLSNESTSIVQSIPKRTMLLWMLTAHIAELAARGGGAVGRTSQAAEGTVSASFDFGTPGSAPWFMQTQYGAAYWQAVVSYRSFRYRPRPTLIR